MVTHKDEFIEKLFEIYERLPKASQPPLDEDRIEAICIETLTLAKEIAIFLNSDKPLSSWEKQQIVLAVNAVNRYWLHAAICGLNLAITDDTISPNIVYDQEIINLDCDRLITFIDQFLNKPPNK